MTAAAGGYRVHVPPNPLKPIQDVVERVLTETGAADFGRSMSSIDDLTAEVQHVYKRVDEIEQRIEQIVPLLERLVVAAEGLEREISPISALASWVPGSGGRRRRREQRAARAARAALGAGQQRPSAGAGGTAAAEAEPPPGATGVRPPR